MVVSAGVSTLKDMQSVYGLEDCYTLAEIVLVDSHNRALANRPNASNN
jgi:hypothetical protein